MSVYHNAGVFEFHQSLSKSGTQYSSTEFLFYLFVNMTYCRHHYMYQAALMRQRFEETRNVTDVRVAQQMLKDGEEELFQKSDDNPIKCE